MTRTTFAAAALAATLLISSVRAQAPAGGALDAATRDALSQTIRGILIESLPEKITGDDDWGETKPAFSGLTWRMKGLKVDVEKREKPVNHGLWKKWELTPLEPEKNLTFKIDGARSIGQTRFAFRITTSSPLFVHVQFERWRSGVKLLNAQLDADAHVAMTLDGEVEYAFEDRDGRTYAVIKPEVKAVDLRLIDLRWRRIGVFDGELMRELADAFDEPAAEALDKQEPKAVEKLNAAVTKKQDKLKVAVPAPLDLSRWQILADRIIEAVE